MIAVFQFGRVGTALLFNLLSLLIFHHLTKQAILTLALNFGDSVGNNLLSLDFSHSHDLVLFCLAHVHSFDRILVILCRGSRSSARGLGIRIGFVHWRRFK